MNMFNFKKPASWLIAAVIVICVLAVVCLLPNSSEAPAAAEIPEASDIPEAAKVSSSTVLAVSQAALDELYDCGILASRFELDAFTLNYSEEVPSSSINQRTFPLCYSISCGTTSGDYVSMIVDSESGKALFFNTDVRGREGDPQLDYEPIDFGAGPMYYYDSFKYIMREDMTLDELCKLLSSYWGFTGYTISGTKDEMYGYDTEAPEGSTTVKSTVNGPYITIYFDGDQPDMPMFIESMYFPGSTHLSFGTGHAVG